jgi:hypothetical protein
MNFKEILVGTLMPVIKSLGQAQISELLAKIKEHNTEELYINTLKSLYSSFSLLNEVAIKTKSKIDDGIVDMILDTVKDAADQEGVVL